MENIPTPPEGRINYLTRKQIVEYLKSEGFTVHGVITQADCSYDKGLGAAYQDFYEPAYKGCMKNLVQYKKDKTKEDSFEKQYLNYSDKLFNANLHFPTKQVSRNL